MSLMREKYKNEFGATDKQIDNMIDTIGHVESKNRNIPQNIGGGKTGTGQGYFQYEMTAKDEKGNFVQGSAVTAVQRVKNAYAQAGKKAPAFTENTGKNYTNTSIGFNVIERKLSKEDQEEMLLADLYIKSGGSFLGRESKQPLLEKALKGDVKELWLKKHWAGAEKLLSSKDPKERTMGAEIYKEKGDQWDRDIETFKKRETISEKADTIAFDEMEKRNKEIKL